MSALERARRAVHNATFAQRQGDDLEDMNNVQIRRVPIHGGREPIDVSEAITKISKMIVDGFTLAVQYLKDRPQLAKKFGLFLLGWLIAFKCEFGAVYFAIACIYLIFTNLGSGKKAGELSAYAAFNPNNYQLPGTFDADQIDRQYRQGNNLIGAAAAAALPGLVGGNAAQRPLANNGNGNGNAAVAGGPGAGVGPAGGAGPGVAIARGGSRKKAGANDPCPCGSGLKFKKCCLLVQRQQAMASANADDRGGRGGGGAGGGGRGGVDPEWDEWVDGIDIDDND